MQEGQWKRLMMPGVKTRTLGLVGFGESRRLAAVYEDSHKRSRETKDQGGNHEAEDRADEKGFFGSPADALLSLQLENKTEKPKRTLVF